LNPAPEIHKDKDSNDLGNEPIDGCTDGCRPTPETPVSDDPDLAQVIEAWDTLPPAIREAILAMLRAAE